MHKLLPLGLLIASFAHSVEIDGTGYGQYLIYPYFDVGSTRQAFLTVENSGQAVALKLRVVDGTSGDAFWSLNLYLGNADVWTAVVMQDPEGLLVVRTRDRSCIVPEGRQTGDVMQFDTGLPVTRGLIEVVEMGELTNEVRRSAHAAEHVGAPGQSFPIDCDQLVDAWSESGYWSLNEETDIAPPRGRVSGELSNIDIDEGTVYSYQAFALADFSFQSIHTAPESLRPGLQNANSDTDDGTVISVIDTGSEQVIDHWDDPIDAVNAALIGYEFQGRYIVAESIGAETNVHITLPTWSFRFDENGMTRPPFERPSNFTDGAPFGYDAFDETGSPFGGFTSCEPTPCRTEALQGIGALTTLPVDPNGRDRTDDRIITGARDSGYINVVSGGARIPFSNAISGNAYIGVPAIMLIQRTYSNGQLRDDAGNRVRANFSDILPMRRTVRIDEP